MATITGFYAALMGALIVYLAARVALCRRDNQIGIGGDDNKELRVLVRAHGNAIENIPIALLLMLLAELNGLNAVLLHLSGIILVAARLAHAKGFIDARGKGSTARFYGILVTWLLILALAIANIALGWLR